MGGISAETNSIRTLEDSLCSVNDWMGQNKLHMNPSKMEYIAFGSKTMIKRTTVTNITVCNDTVIHSPCIKSYMDTDSLKTTVQALYISHLDYSNAMFYGLPTKDINHLQHVQNYCAKIVHGKTKYDSSMACLKQLH